MKKSSLVAFLLLLAACAPSAPTPLSAASLPPAATATWAKPSSTPEPSATFTALPPTSLPRFFTEEFEGTLPDWSILQNNVSSAPGTKMENGSLVFELSLPYQWVYALIGTQQYEDARIDTLAQSRGTSPDAIGLICRYSEANGWYEFNVSNDGDYTVLFGQWLDKGVAQYLPIASDRNEYLKSGGQGNELGLLCQGDNLWLYTNGKLFRKLDVARFGLRQGKFGLAVSSFENIPVAASFDWVKVSSP